MTWKSIEQLLLQPENVEIVSGILGPKEARLIRCNADVHVEEAHYVSGCGAGDSDGCGRRTASIEVKDPRMMVLPVDDGTHAFAVDTVQGRTNVVEVSTDCRQWATATNIVGGDLPYLIRDPQTNGMSARFYRARIQ